MKYVFDIDGTLTKFDSNKDYQNAIPDMIAIKEVNRLYNEGHHIVLFTARGASTGINWHNLTVSQLEKWGIKYHELIDTGKPSWDIFIDDKAINANQWKNEISPKIIGFVASAFDLLHPGHCLMLKDAKSKCDILIAALQEDPSLDRNWKNKPIMSLQERQILLESNKYVDKIIIYKTENDLLELLKKIRPDIRILGSDYETQQEKIIGKEFCKNIYFHNRNIHDWSTTELKNRIKKL